MRRQTIIDVVPMNVNGETVYRETSLRGFRGLGVVNTAAIVSTSTNIANLAAAASSAIPSKPVTIQSDFSKTANVVATGAATVAAIAVVFVPVGPVIAAVAGVVAGAAALLGKIFQNSKAKGYAAERGEYEKVNAEIKYENVQLDAQYDAAYKAINEMKAALSSLNGLSYDDSTLNGLGLCLWNCKDEKAKLQSAKAEYETLVTQQNNKTTLLASLLDEYNKLLKAGFELKANKSTKDWILWILLGAAALGGGYYLYKKSK